MYRYQCEYCHSIARKMGLCYLIDQKNPEPCASCRNRLQSCRLQPVCGCKQLPQVPMACWRRRRIRTVSTVVAGILVFLLSGAIFRRPSNTLGPPAVDRPRAKRSVHTQTLNRDGIDKEITGFLRERYGDESLRAIRDTHFRHAVSIDETGPQRYYARRDLEAWRIALDGHNFTVSERLGPFRPAYFGPNAEKAVSVLLCMAMSRIEKKCITPIGLLALRGTVRLNQLHGFRSILWRKDAFCTTLEAATADAAPEVSAKFRKHLFPCWTLPAEATRLQGYMVEHPDVVYAVKPSSRGEGRGIYLASDFGVIHKEMTSPRQVRKHGPNRVVQRLLTDPFLLQGRKFDLRCYVLVTSIVHVGRGAHNQHRKLTRTGHNVNGAVCRANYPCSLDVQPEATIRLTQQSALCIHQWR
eukprot:m.500074 g.500074  ORF g.500074 m.500074 type:complete len:412 (+) comp21829_c0_seq23:190-1425(+)